MVREESDDVEIQKGKDSEAYHVERYWKFFFLVTGIVFFFGCHNYMQELIMHLPGFKVIYLIVLQCFISY